MKRRMMAVLVSLVAAAVLILGGVQLYRIFVTDRIMDKDGMENPFISEVPDGTGTSEEDTKGPNE